MTDHADLIARLRARAETMDPYGSGVVGPYRAADARLDRDAADALSRPATVTEEMVERTATTLADYMAGVRDAEDWAIAQRGVRAILTAALGEPAAGADRVRHRKRGTTYTVVGPANIQTDTPLTDHAAVIVYRSEHDGTMWVRPVSEFHDGRFEALGETSLQKAQGSAPDDPAKRTGALGMKYGDRVEMDGRLGTAGQFFHDGEVEVRFDDGKTEVVKWRRIKPASLFSRPTGPGPETYPGHDPAAGLPQPSTEKGGDANFGPDGPLLNEADNAQPRSPDTAGGAELDGFVSIAECVDRVAEATAAERESAAERMNAAYSEWWRLGNEHGERFAAWKRGGEKGPMPESRLGSLPDYLAAAIRGGGE